MPGGKKKYPNVRYSQELSENNEAPPEWLGEIEPTFLSYEAVPVLNIPFFNEVFCPPVCCCSLASMVRHCSLCLADVTTHAYMVHMFLCL